jgi:hypothetical protein
MHSCASGVVSSPLLDFEQRMPVGPSRHTTLSSLMMTARQKSPELPSGRISTLTSVVGLYSSTSASALISHISKANMTAAVTQMNVDMVTDTEQGFCHVTSWRCDHIPGFEPAVHAPNKGYVLKEVYHGFEAGSLCR